MSVFAGTFDILFTEGIAKMYFSVEEICCTNVSFLKCKKNSFPCYAGHSVQKNITVEALL